MAQGKIPVIIESANFVKGMSTSSNLADGGFSPESEGINLLANPGVVHASPPLTLLGTVDGRIIASCFDSFQSNSVVVDKYLITDAASIYILKGGVPTRLGTAGGLGSSNNFKPGAVDCVQFDFDGSGNPQVYVSNGANASGDIARVVVDATAATGTITNNWGSTVSGGTSLTNNPHPMIVFNKTLFIADGKYLHTWDGTTFVKRVLTLRDVECITALNIDPSTGRMLIGVASRGSLSSTSGDITRKVSNQAYIGLYDGINPTQFLRKIPVDAVITTILNCAGVSFITYGDCFGYWDGKGLNFLRKLNVQFGEMDAGINYNIYKQKICNIQNVIFIAVNPGTTNPFLSNTSTLVIGYGEVQAGIKAFFNVFTNGDGNILDTIINYKDDALIICKRVAGTETIYSFPIMDGQFNGAYPPNVTGILSTGDSSPVFVTSPISFPRPSTVNQVRIFFEQPVTNDGTTIGNFALIGDRRTTDYNVDISNPSIASGPTTWFDIFPDDIITTECQVKYQWKETTKNHGIQKIMLWYTPNE